MAQKMFDLKANGKYKTYDTLYDEAVDVMIEAIENLCVEEQLSLGNEYRENELYDPHLNKNDSDMVDELLEDMKPSEILGMYYDDCTDFVSFNGYELCCTNEVFEGFDVESLARYVLDGEIRYRDLPYDIQIVVDAFEEAKFDLEDLARGRKMASDVLDKFLNNEADVGDLLQVLDKLVRNDDLWE